MSTQNVYLVVTSAFVLAGEIAKPGELVEVSDSEARDLLNRGKARPATEEDGVPVPQTVEAEPEKEPEQEEEPAKPKKK